jgi:hypothetical protein
MNRYLSCQRRAELAQKIDLTELQIKVMQSIFLNLNLFVFLFSVGFNAGKNKW